MELNDFDLTDMDQDIDKLDEKSIKIGIKTNSVSDDNTTFLEMDQMQTKLVLLKPGYEQKRIKDITLNFNPTPKLHEKVRSLPNL